MRSKLQQRPITVIRNSPSQRAYLAIHKPIRAMTYNCVNNTIIYRLTFCGYFVTTFCQVWPPQILNKKRLFYVTFIYKIKIKGSHELLNCLVVVIRLRVKKHVHIVLYDCYLQYEHSLLLQNIYVSQNKIQFKQKDATQDFRYNKRHSNISNLSGQTISN